MLLPFGIAWLLATAGAQEPAIQVQLEELRQSNEELKRLLMDQQARMETLERRVGRGNGRATAPPITASSKNGYSAKASLEDLPPLEPEPNLISMKRSGDGSSTLQLYGFARLDAIYDDNQAGLDELLGFAASDDTDSDSDDFYLHPKLTRLGVDFNGPALDNLGGAELSGKAEVDFYRQFDTSESRSEFRGLLPSDTI